MTNYPILESLGVSPQVMFDLITAGVESERTIYTTYKNLGDDRRAWQSLNKILQGTRVLNFMRINSLLETLDNLK